MTSQALAMFERLLDIACDRMAGQAPVLVTSSAAPEAGGWDLPFRWQTQKVKTPTELPDSVNRLLPEGPVLLVPPWIEPKGSNVPSPMAEAVLNCTPTGPGALLIALLPASALSSARHRPLREGLAARWSFTLLLFGRGVLPAVHFQFEIAAVVLSSTQSTSPIRFFQLPPRSAPDEVEKDFHRLLKRSGGRGRYGYVHRDPVLPGDSLAFTKYDPDLLSQKDDLAGYGGTVTLGTLFDISRGQFHPSRSEEVTSGEQGPDTVRIISSRDITRGGLIAPADDDSRWANVPPDSCLRAGDVVLRALHSPTDSGGLIAAEVTEPDLPLVATHTVLTLRAKIPFDEPDWLVILQFLRMPLAKSLVFASSGSGIHLLLQALADLPIPRPDHAMRAAINNLIEARSRFAGWHTEADTLLNSVFAGGSSEISRARVVRIGRNVRLRSDAAAALDDIGYTFRTRFPYPLAHRWRRMEAAHSAGANREAYTAVLDIAEVLCAYASLLGLAFAREAGVELSSLGQIREALGHNGPTFGTWIATLQEICGANQRKNIPMATPLHDLRSLLASQEAKDAIDALARRRNNESHQRRFAEAELPQAFPQALAELTTLMTSAIVLTDLRLLQVTSTGWDRIRRINKIHYWEFMGDHHVVSTQTMEHPSFELEKDSLYILDGQQRLHPLRPYLLGLNCPVCHIWSTFHVEQATNSATVFKGLEHGHTFKESEPLGALKHTGLI